ncbi:hypothetical protein [Microbacterium thalassium]|uniref:Uncharacterized protein n=1 Tax=Microbacterium thalassium TaxID=362649 RepID=A0A7X0FRA2_9MICO|nr:hypothetical protein [Microbacterium thalassium]MBB6392248.1 hypothetical protein [Microbacterium thalassium]GLK23459.1 hypothetical protein GCM10017607_07770 [Microbacterium thalassium]
MGDDYSTYWATIAQIVPVLAVAFIFEARLFSRSFSKKKVLAATKPMRVLYAVLYVGIAFVLFAVFQVALTNLRANVEPTAQATFWPELGLVSAAGLALFVPALNLGVALVSDVAIDQWNRLPFSRVGRREREVSRLRAEVYAMNRLSAEQHRQIVHQFADQLTRLSYMDRMARRDPDWPHAEEAKAMFADVSQEARFWFKRARKMEKKIAKAIRKAEARDVKMKELRRLANLRASAAALKTQV